MQTSALTQSCVRKVRNCRLSTVCKKYHIFVIISLIELLSCGIVYLTILQRWLYCREHLKYVWNVYCVLTNAITCEIFTPQKPQATNSFLAATTNYFRFVLTFSFFYKQTITFPSHLFNSMCYNSEEYRFERLWNKLQSRCAGRDACQLTDRIEIHQSQPDRMT